MIGWDDERDPRVGDLALRPDQALGHRRFGNQERPGDLGGGEAGDAAQGERHLVLDANRRMAAPEDEPELIVTHPGLLLGGIVVLAANALLQPPDELGLVPADLLSPESIDGTPTGHRGDPRAWPIGDALVRPGRERGLGRLLRGVLGQLEVPQITRQGGHDPRPLLAHDAGDRGFDAVGHLSPVRTR